MPAQNSTNSEQNRKLEEDLTYISNLLDYSSEFDATIDIMKNRLIQCPKTLRDSTGNEAPAPEVRC